MHDMPIYAIMPQLCLSERRCEEDLQHTMTAPEFPILEWLRLALYLPDVGPSSCTAVVCAYTCRKP